MPHWRIIVDEATGEEYREYLPHDEGNFAAKEEAETSPVAVISLPTEKQKKRLSKKSFKDIGEAPEELREKLKEFA